MRILHVLNHTRRQNGHVHAAVDLACAQVALGHGAAICSSGGDFDQLLADHGVETLQARVNCGPATASQGIVGLYRCAREWEVDIVHAHMITSAALSWPVTRFLRIPLVTTVHNAFQRRAVLMGVGDRVIAVSEAVAGTMQRAGIPQRRLRVVLNGTVGTARHPYPPPPAAQLRHPAIVFVGGLHPRKGIDVLLHAFALMARRTPSSALYIVGDGPCRSEYERLAETLDLAGRVSFCGSLADPRGHLRAADIFVLPSRSDPAPLVICEAREAGCAIVASGVDGIPELLDGGHSGLLVPPNDPQRLATAILTLNDPARLALYRQRSRDGLDRFTVERVARDTLRIYEEAIGAKAHAARSGDVEDRPRDANVRSSDARLIH